MRRIEGTQFTKDGYGAYVGLGVRKVYEERIWGHPWDWGHA